MSLSEHVSSRSTQHLSLFNHMSISNKRLALSIKSEAIYAASSPANWLTIIYSRDSQRAERLTIMGVRGLHPHLNQQLSLLRLHSPCPYIPILSTPDGNLMLKQNFLFFVINIEGGHRPVSWFVSEK